MSNSDVMVRLSLMGAAAFKAATREAGSGLRQLGTDSEVASSRMSRVRAASDAAFGAVRGLGAIALPALGYAAYDAGKQAMAFNAQMEMVRTQAGATQGEVNRLSGQVLDLSKSLPQGPQQLAQGLFHLESIGLRGAKAMAALKVAAQGAAVGNANLEDTATALGSAWLVNIKGAGNLKHVMGLLNATVGAGNMKMQDLVDSLGTGILPAAKTAGLGIKDVMGALAVFTDEGYQASSASAQLGTALHFLYAPTTKAANALATIGLPANRLALDMHKPNGLLVALRDLKTHLDSLPGGSKGVQAEGILGQILPGGRGRVLLTLMNQLTRYQMKLNQIGSGTKKFGADVVATSKTAAYRIHEAWSGIQSDMIQLGSRLLPLVAPALSGAAKLVNQVTAGLTTGHTTIQRRTGMTALQAHQLGGPGSASVVTHQASFAQRAGAGLHSTIGWLIKTVVPAAKSAITQLIAAFKPAMPYFQNVLLPLLKGIGEGVLGSVVAAFKAGIIVIRVWATAMGWLGGLLKPFKGVIEDIGKVIGFLYAGEILRILAVIPKVGTAFKLLRLPILFADAAVREIAGALRFALPLFDRGLTAVSRFVGSFTGWGRRIVTPVLNAFRSVLNALGSVPGKFLSFGGKIGSAIISGLVKLIKSAPGAIMGALLSIVPGPLRGAVKKVLGAVGAAGSALGTVAGIVNPANWFASGGVVRNRGLQVVGERGPELAALPVGTRIFNANQTRSMLTARAMPTAFAGGVQIVIYPTIPVEVQVDGKAIHKGVYRAERQIVESK